ncbi:hypothetical protein [Phytoactinopolyspora halophila]|uniref:hypothetical protein n=1 Tax=Phytoactinopolyspora halophila TaxID=1981511 RepID=UPI0014782B87|nr:hypothetical protein [Phytoactinopolyspora halophila]
MRMTERMAAIQTATISATHAPSADCSHRGASVAVPVTYPIPSIQVAHAVAPSVLKARKRGWLTPASPAAAALAVRPSGMNRPATMVPALADPMRA